MSLINGTCPPHFLPLFDSFFFKRKLPPHLPGTKWMGVNEACYIGGSAAQFFSKPFFFRGFPQYWGKEGACSNSQESEEI